MPLSDAESPKSGSDQILIQAIASKTGAVLVSGPMHGATRCKAPGGGKLGPVPKCARYW
jgi:hypothetical protein